MEPIVCIKVCVIIFPMVNTFHFLHILFILIIYNINNTSIFLLFCPSGMLSQNLKIKYVITLSINKRRLIILDGDIWKVY